MNTRINTGVLWCPEGDLNPHVRLRTADFKSAASASFAIRAYSFIVPEQADSMPRIRRCASR